MISALYYSNRYFYQRWMRTHRWKYAQRTLKDIEPELYNSIREMISAVKLDADVPNGRYSDALFLYDQTLRIKPRHILECGAGVSSLVFSYAMEKLYQSCDHQGQITSLDESAQYLDELVKPIIPEILLSRINFIPSDVDIKIYQNIQTGYSAPGIFYTATSQASYDLIYVDGPQVRTGLFDGLEFTGEYAELPVGLKQKPFDADCLNVLISATEKVHIVIDQRIDTRWKLMSLLDKPFQHSYSFSARKTAMFVPPLAATNLERHPIS